MGILWIWPNINHDQTVWLVLLCLLFFFNLPNPELFSFVSQYVTISYIVLASFIFIIGKFIYRVFHFVCCKLQLTVNLHYLKLEASRTA